MSAAAFAVPETAGIAFFTVQHQLQRPQLLLLPDPIALAQFPALPVKDHPRQAVPALALID